MPKGIVAQFGEIMQLAYVVDSIDAGIEYWTSVMGAGPFYVFPNIKMEGFKYRGQPTDADFSLALGYWGDMQIELIEQHNTSPSIYQAWKDAGHQGLHHGCIVVDDIEATRAACVAQGFEILQEGKIPGGGAIYIDTRGGPGTMIELIEMPEGLKGACVVMRDAARNWDGSEPKRSFG